MRHAEPHSVGLLASTGSVSPDAAGELPNAEVFAAIMVALTPNVKNIVSTNIGKHHPRFRPGSLARLESVALHHMSTSGGCSLGDIAGILKAAPNLKRFVGFGISGMPDSFSHYAVKEVLLSHSQLEPGAVARWFTAFPLLEAFRSEGGGLRGAGSDEPMPAEFWSGILKRKSTLRHLALQQEEMRHIYAWDRDVTEDDLLGSLSSMEVMETIQIHAGYLYLDHKPGRDEPHISSIPGAAADEYAWYLQSIRKDRIRILDEANEERATNLPVPAEADGANEDWEMLYSQHVQSTENEDRCSTNVDDMKANEDDSAAEPQHTLDGGAHGRLVAFLPKSIRKLTITGLASSAFNDVLDLINISPELFPNLKEVNFPGMHDADDSEWIAEDFEYIGIKFSFKEESINIHGDWAI